MTNIEDQLKVVRLFPSMVSDEEKDSFLSDFSLSEIEGVLKGLEKEKSPELDGWPVKFYLHFLSLLVMTYSKLWSNHVLMEGCLVH